MRDLLVLGEVADHQGSFAAFEHVSITQANRHQQINKQVGIQVVARHNLHLDTLGLFKEPAVIVGKIPEPDEQQPGLIGELDDLLVSPKLRLDSPDTGHYMPPEGRGTRFARAVSPLGVTRTCVATRSSPCSSVPRVLIR
ncbi:hypothetical protein D9M71_122350 [compost metagenome]